MIKVQVYLALPIIAKTPTLSIGKNGESDAVVLYGCI